MGHDPTFIDVAVDRLVAAYRHAGLPPIRRADDVEAVLAEIRTEIAPLRLPEELERFWRLVDPESITLAPYPHPTSAAFALHCWKSHQDGLPGMPPRLLFPVCYESHGFLFVELDNGREPGGACLEWGYAGSPFYVRFPNLSGYVDLLATMIELGEFSRQQREAHSWIEFDPERHWEDAQAVRLTAAQPLPGFGDARELDEDVRRWPERWLLSNGLTADVRSLRGANTSIAELLRAAAAGDRTAGTIRARVTSLAGSGQGCRITVDDGSGSLDVWCPAEVSIYGPVITRLFEFDVAVSPNPAAAPDLGIDLHDVQRHALSHDMEGAQAAVADLYAKAFGTSAAAEATAIRPVD